MPQYVPLVFGATGLSLVAALGVPAPRMSLDRAAWCCRLLALLALLALVAAATLPAFDVWYPSLALAAAGLSMWFAMFWIARQPDLDAVPVRAAQDADADDDEGGGPGGGGGPADPDDPPEPPSPSGGLDWDAFDAERSGWERTVAPPRERELVGV